MVTKSRAASEEVRVSGRRDSAIVPKAKPLCAPDQIVPYQSFLERVLKSLQRAVPCASAFCVIQAARARFPSGWRTTRTGDSAITCDAPLSVLLGIQSDVELPSRRGIHRLTDPEATCVPGLTEFCARIGVKSTHLLSILCNGGRCVGVLVLERDEEFTSAEREQLEHISAFITASATSETKAGDLQCEAAILRALGPGPGVDLLFDRQTAKVIWSSCADVDWFSNIELTEATLSATLDDFFAAQARGDVVLAAPGLPLGSLIAAAEIETETPAGKRCTAVRVRPESHGTLPTRLSAREREVAQLIVNGFAPANIAALTGLSEPTVRTYIRRMYKKLNVCNRAALVRTLLTPEVR